MEGLWEKNKAGQMIVRNGACDLDGMVNEGLLKKGVFEQRHQESGKQAL